MSEIIKVIDQIKKQKKKKKKKERKEQRGVSLINYFETKRIIWVKAYCGGV